MARKRSPLHYLHYFDKLGEAIENAYQDQKLKFGMDTAISAVESYVSGYLGSMKKREFYFENTLKVQKINIKKVMIKN